MQMKYQTSKTLINKHKCKNTKLNKAYIIEPF